MKPIEIACHIGANCTDEERLLKSILKNATVLLEQDIVVPGPSKYRRLLRETLQGLDGAPPKPGTRDILLDAIVEEDDVRRVILSNDNFISIPKRMFDHGVFYPQTESKIRGFCRLFPDDQITFFIGIRHPASFLQEVASRAEAPRLRDFLGLLSPLELRWANLVARIRKTAPHARVVVWCNEDTPIIWEDLLRAITGVHDQTDLTGQHDLLGRIVSKEGMYALAATIKAAPPADRIARHEQIADVIEAHGKAAALEDEITYPEMGAQLVAAMTQTYEDDITTLDDMDGVEMILPFR